MSPILTAPSSNCRKKEARHEQCFLNVVVTSIRPGHKVIVFQFVTEQGKDSILDGSFGAHIKRGFPVRSSCITVEIKHKRIHSAVRTGTNRQKRETILTEWYRNQLRMPAESLISKWEGVFEGEGFRMRLISNCKSKRGYKLLSEVNICSFFVNLVLDLLAITCQCNGLNMQNFDINRCFGKKLESHSKGCLLEAYKDFLPTMPCGMPVFKTGAIDHSTTPPAVCGCCDCSRPLLSPVRVGFGKCGVGKNREGTFLFQNFRNQAFH